MSGQPRREPSRAWPRTLARPGLSARGGAGSEPRDDRHRHRADRGQRHISRPFEYARSPPVLPLFHSFQRPDREHRVSRRRISIARLRGPTRRWLDISPGTQNRCSHPWCMARPCGTRCVPPSGRCSPTARRPSRRWPGYRGCRRGHCSAGLPRRARRFTRRSRKFARPWLWPCCAIARSRLKRSPFFSGTPSRAPSFGSFKRWTGTTPRRFRVEAA